MEKVCTICHINKDVSNFHKGSGNRVYQSYCKDCRKIYDAERHKKNRVERYQQIKNLRKERKIWWVEFKSSLNCKECGENHPAALQFHHINPKEKDFALAESIGRGWSKEKIMREVDKCDVLCANCHLKFHWNEQRESDSW